MASKTSDLARPGEQESSVGARINARQDSIAGWSFPTPFLVIIGIGFLFTYYDVADINVSFIQTCTQIVAGCTPATATNFIGLPTLLSLSGYIVGALLLAPFSDRYGRRNMLLFTLLLTGLGSLYTAFVGDYTNFIIARMITGIGIGADLAIVSTYVNEVAPVGGRGKYISLVFTMGCALGSLLGIWLALYLTLPSAPFPAGLPFSVAAPTLQGPGWRIVYGVGASLTIIGVLLRFELPESPRWLVSVGRLAEADAVVREMERRTIARYGALPPVLGDLPVTTSVNQVGYGEILHSPLYLKRVVLTTIFWLLIYASIYSIVSGGTVALVTLGYQPPVAGLIIALGAFGLAVGGFLAIRLAERFERQTWLVIATLPTIVGGIISAEVGHRSFSASVLGIFLIWVGLAIFTPIAYTWSTENFPTRARAIGFALGDGIGHLGGGVAVLAVGPIVASLGGWGFFLLLGGYYLAAAGVSRLGIQTRNKRLDEVAP